MDARRWFQFGYEDLFVFFSWWTWRTRTESARRAASSVTSRWTLKTSRWVKREETALHHRLNNEKHAEWDYCQNICDREDYNQFIRNQAFTSDLCAWVHTWSSSSAPPGVWQDLLIPSQTESQFSRGLIWVCRPAAALSVHLATHGQDLWPPHHRWVFARNRSSGLNHHQVGSHLLLFFQVYAEGNRKKCRRR